MTQAELDQQLGRWARMGYGSRGVIYLVIGGLALLAALGERGGQTTSSKGAMLKILEQPFGNVLFFLLIIGLLGYSTWRAIQCFKDPDGHGSSGKGLAVRTGLLISAVAHTALAFWAAKLLIGAGSGGSLQNGGNGFLTTNLGQIALGIAGIAVIVTGFARIYKGATARFEKYMNIPSDKRRWARPVCQFGLIARGVVWLIIGWLLIKAAWLASGGEIGGTSEALAMLRDQSYGRWLLGIVAAGLFSFGIYCFLEAAYRRINCSIVDPGQNR
ncbi:DUF1206 domain-containing protein [Oxalobacteraceae bacterium R-40]|uniref:DUF1206 domain-containing protein n=1 Tax=Keguizhuia sedimenti TaxID=3064264 RepID=A0ABU1BRX2_9BURK|nr:DUF1206 domain-containing protein [Oxalobacteraceae bacterium R-40]